MDVAWSRSFIHEENSLPQKNKKTSPLVCLLCLNFSGEQRPDCIRIVEKIDLTTKKKRKKCYIPIKVLLHFTCKHESNIKHMINFLSLYLPFIWTAGAEASIDFPEHSTATQSSGATHD